MGEHIPPLNSALHSIFETEHLTNSERGKGESRMENNRKAMQHESGLTLAANFWCASSKRGSSAMYRLWLGAILCVSASAQTNPLFGRLSLGVVGGVPITGGTSSEARRYIVGPSAEFRLSNHFVLNFSPQYKRYYSDGGFIFPIGAVLEQLMHAVDIPPTLTIQSFGQTRRNAWEFPLMVKYYFGSPQRTIRPFIETGYDFSKSWGTARTNSVILDTATFMLTPQNSVDHYSGPLYVGPSFGAGALIQRRWIGVSPQIRYTLWDYSTFGRPRGQLDFLLQIRF
jgi:hypothetical protein